MRKLFLESVAGVAGDMFSAAFVDAGLVSEALLQELPKTLRLDGVEVRIKKVLRASARSSYIEVAWTNESWKQVFSHPSFAKVPLRSRAEAHWHAHYPDLDRFLETATLHSDVKNLSRRIFRLLAEAEAAVHGAPSLDQVTFHEVGTIDSILDVVMAATCLRELGSVQILASPVRLGRGLVRMEHGEHPVPPPASARLAQGMQIAGVPSGIARENVELSTPTGLAILKALGPQWCSSIPSGRLIATGAGAGTMELDGFPNIFRVHVVEGEEREAARYQVSSVTEIRVNLDDQTPERTAWAAEKLMSLGALDVWTTAVTGKKGRIALHLSLLCSSGDADRLCDWILRNTTSFGVRWHESSRYELEREIETQVTELGSVRYKVGRSATGEILKRKPEYEDLKAIWEKKPDFLPPR